MLLSAGLLAVKDRVLELLLALTLVSVFESFAYEAGFCAGFSG